MSAPFRIAAITDEFSPDLETALPAMREAGMKMKLIDYVPCYRSPAGTGNAMAFAYWRV